MAERITPGELLRSFREYLAVHPGLSLSGHDMDNMALDLARVAMAAQAGRDDSPDTRKMVGELQAEIAGHEAAIGHLSRMVDELRELAQDAKQAMTALNQAAIPDESQEGVPAIIPPDAFHRFVDAHAQLCFCLHRLGHDGPREQPQRYEITSIKYLAGELTLRAMDGAEVPQALETGQVVAL